LKFERSDYSANSPNALHAYLLISILSIPVDPVFEAKAESKKIKAKNHKNTIFWLKAKG